MERDMVHFYGDLEHCFLLTTSKYHDQFTGQVTVCRLLIVCFCIVHASTLANDTRSDWLKPVTWSNDVSTSQVRQTCFDEKLQIYQ